MSFEKLLSLEISEIVRICSNPILWAEFFLVLPRTNEKFKANYVQTKILNSTSKSTIVCVHRRAGKTYCSIIKMLHKAFTVANSEILVIAPGESQLEKIFSDIDDILECNPDLSADRTIKRGKPHPIRKFANGSHIKGFIAKNGSASLRGQAGDLIIVDEADFIDSEEWKVIDPIVRGDKNRKPPELLAQSTPNTDPKSRFLQMLRPELLSEDDIGEDARYYLRDLTSVFVPLDQNPEYSPEEVDEIKQTYLPDRLAEYQQEYLCQPVSSSGKLVFKRNQVMRAATLEFNFGAKFNKHGYPDYKDIPKKLPEEKRAIGIDWDRIQAGPSILMISWHPGIPFYRVLYRFEVDKNLKEVYNIACTLALDICSHCDVDYLYSEASSDYATVEMLKLRCRTICPRMYNRIEGISYNENHVSEIKRTNEQIKRRLKGVIVGHLQVLFENERIRFPEQDAVLIQQLSSYEVIGKSERGDTYSKKNEHFIDALGLACWAIYKNHDNPLEHMGISLPLLSVSVDISSKIPKKFKRSMVVSYSEDTTAFSRSKF